jgi:polysaccharide biosynthesis/export protein
MKDAKIIRRTTGEKPQEIPIDLKKIMTAKMQDVRLEPEDIVFVPSSTGKAVGMRTLDSIVRIATGMAVYRVP